MQVIWFMKAMFPMLKNAFRKKFNTPAALVAEEKACGYFMQELDKKTLGKVTAVLQMLQLPVPQKNEQCLSATEGFLMFSNDYGIVIRIEKKNPRRPEGILRLNDNPWIIQPLGSFAAGDMIVEICPACHVTQNPEVRRALQRGLKETGVEFWDYHDENTGLLPLKTPEFPTGVPVVIDRLAVSRLSISVGRIKSLLAKIWPRSNVGAQDPQSVLYASLRRALAEAWPKGQETPDPAKIKDFWRLCRHFVCEGKLVAGWNEGNEGKIKKAQDAAVSYDALLKQSPVMTLLPAVVRAP